MAWTVDDLIFSGWSLWVRPTPDDPDGPVGRVNMGDWGVNDDNRITVHDQPISDEQAILIPGLHEGILSFGADALADARSLYAVVRQRLLNPVPQLNLHQTTDAPMTDPEIDALIARWANARQGKNGGVGYTNHAIEVQELGGGGDAQLMIAARNASSVDLARVIGVTASVIDATADKASLTYETTTGRNDEFVEVDLALYMTPITARLSLDDVVPPGERVAFDLSDYTAPDPAATGPITED
jgi:phage portal protein BeeE